MKKKIILSLPYGMSIRDLIDEKFLLLLSKQFEIIIFSSVFENTKSLSFIKKFKGISFLPYKKNFFIESILISLISNLQTIKYLNKKKILSFSTIREALKNGNSNKILENDYKKLNSFFLNIICKFNIIYFPIVYLSKIFLFIFSLKYFFLFFNKNVQFFFTSHPYCNLDYSLEYCAKIFNLKTIAMIHSWDNVTTKLLMHFKYYKVFVWNKILKNQLISIYKYKSKDIKVIGIPQFDDYHKNENYYSKKYFLKNTKIKNKKIVTIFCGCPDLTPKYDKILYEISNLFERKELKSKFKLILRCHPGYDYSWTKKIYNKNTYINIPENLSVPMEVKSLGRYKEEKKFLSSVLKYSDVIINFFSTTTLDAVYFDKPVIGISFDLEKNPNKAGSQLSYYFSWTHYKNLMNSNGIDLCTKMEDLTGLIKIQSNIRKKKGRKNIFQDQIVFGDGNSRLRLAKEMIKLKN